MMSHTYITADEPCWAVALNHIDGDCETMPFHFATQAAAEEYGQEWVADQDTDANYWTTEVEPPGYPAYKMGNRWICDGPEGRFHARTKRELIEMLKHGGEAHE